VVEAVERGFRYRPQLKVAISDGSRHTLVLRFFHFHKAQADLLRRQQTLCGGQQVLQAVIVLPCEHGGG